MTTSTKKTTAKKTTKSGNISVAKRIQAATEVIRTGRALECERVLRKSKKELFVVGCAEYKAGAAFAKALYQSKR